MSVEAKSEMKPERFLGLVPISGSRWTKEAWSFHLTALGLSLNRQLVSECRLNRSEVMAISQTITAMRKTFIATSNTPAIAATNSAKQ